jgi:hypothetical protein
MKPNPEVKISTARLVFFLPLFFLAVISWAQPDFSIELVQEDFPELPGVQSYAHAGYDGKWLIIGGRLDGLHRRMPFASFAPSDNNADIFVIDPVARQVWTQPLSPLPASLEEQLQSTNMEHTQVGDILYLIGGYAHSPTAGDHITFPYLTAVDVPGLVQAILAGEDINPFFRQVQDERMAVTGGQLEKMNDFFYLVGGQRFDGRYNPMGPDHGPGFSQQYTDEIRKFRIVTTGEQLSIEDYSSIHDEANLHRRDYNMVPQIFPGGTYGFTAFSGVFQHNVDLPFLNTVNITDSGYVVNNDFTQYLSHYHSARVALYDEQQNHMHTLFFGGISQFYVDAQGNLAEDQDVPFVRTISRVTRFADGSMTEIKMPVEMPGLLGAGSEFLPAESLPLYDNGVIRLSDLPADSAVLIGYVFGGIESELPNIFWEFDDQSIAANRLLAVYLNRSSVTRADPVRLDGTNPVTLTVFPNPTAGRLQVKFSTPDTGKVHFLIQDANGRIVSDFEAHTGEAGSYDAELEVNNLPAGVYFLHLHQGRFIRSRKFAIAKE